MRTILEAATCRSSFRLPFASTKSLRGTRGAIIFNEYGLLMNKDASSFEPTTAVTRFLSKVFIDNFKKRRRARILRDLELGHLSVDSKTLESDEFISAYLATENALMKASSESKFNFLIELFIQGCNSHRLIQEPDSYQEALSIVDELSERELTILYHLYNYERAHGDMDGQLSRDHGHQVEYLVNATGLMREHVIALLVRLRRTGLLITFSEKSESVDIMLGGIEIMFISPIADELKFWVFGVIEGVFVIKS